MKKVAYKFNSQKLGQAFFEELIGMGYERGSIHKKDFSDHWGVNCIKNFYTLAEDNPTKIGTGFYNSKYSRYTFQLESQYQEALDFAKREIRAHEESNDLNKKQIEEYKNPKPEFKKGDWIVGEDNMSEKNIIAKIIDINEPNKHGNYWIESTHNEYGLYFIGKTLRHAAKEEIEQALIKEAKRRGFKGGARAKSMYTKSDIVYEIDTYYTSSYSISTDTFWFGGFCIYKDGKWSEIIEEQLTIAGYDVEDNGFHNVKIGCQQFSKQYIMGFLHIFDSAIDNNIELSNKNIDTLRKIVE